MQDLLTNIYSFRYLHIRWKTHHNGSMERNMKQQQNTKYSLAKMGKTKTIILDNLEKSTTSMLYPEFIIERSTTAARRMDDRCKKTLDMVFTR